MKKQKTILTKSLLILGMLLWTIFNVVTDPDLGRYVFLYVGNLFRNQHEKEMAEWAFYEWKHVRNRNINHWAYDGGREFGNRMMLKYLDDSNPVTRHWAVSNLAEWGDETFAPQLLKLLDDENETVRHKAAYAIRRLGNDECYPALVRALKNDSDNENLIIAIAQIGRVKAAKPLMEAYTKGTDKSVRVTILRHLGEIRATTSVDFLIDVIRQNRESDEAADVSICEQAVIALGKIGDSEAVEILIDLLKNAFLKCYAVASLAKIGDRRAVQPIVRVIQDYLSSEAKYKNSQEFYISELASFKDRSAIPLFEEILNSPNAPRGEGAIALARLGGNRYSKQIRIALARESSYIEKAGMRYALWLLGDKSQEQRIVDEMVAYRPKRKTSSLEEPIRILGEMRSVLSIEVLEDILMSGSSTESIEAAKALGKIGNEEAASILLRCLLTRDNGRMPWLVREYILRSLGLIRDKRAVDPLIFFVLNNVDSNSRNQSEGDYVALALGAIGDKRAIPCLEKLAKEGRFYSRKSAKEALRMLRGSRASF